jgi:hypothetical protein
MTHLTKFALSFTAGFGLLFGAVSILVAHATSTFSWSAVTVALAVGLSIGALLLAQRLPALLRAEIERVYATLMNEFIVAAMRQCGEHGIELDAAALYAETEAAARERLQGMTFQTIDITEELRHA